MESSLLDLCVRTPVAHRIRGQARESASAIKPRVKKAGRDHACVVSAKSAISNRKFPALEA
jgi:hypothetical protein